MADNLATEQFIDPCELPAHLINIARDELGETPRIMRQGLLELRKQITQLECDEDKIKDLSDKNLMRFLRFKKFNIVHALQETINLRRFYIKHAEALVNLDKSNEFLKFGSFLQVLDERDPKGRVIVVMRPKKAIHLFTPEFIAENPHAVLRFNVWLFEKLSHDINLQVCGMLVFVTFTGLTFWDQITMNTMAPITDQLAVFQFLQILGCRLGGAYVFEEPPFMSWLWYFIRPFMNAKITGRFQLCGCNYEEVLEKVLPGSRRGILPDCFPGGLLREDDSHTSNWVTKQCEQSLGDDVKSMSKSQSHCKVLEPQSNEYSNSSHVELIN